MRRNAIKNKVELYRSSPFYSSSSINVKNTWHCFSLWYSSISSLLPQVPHNWFVFHHFSLSLSPSSSPFVINNNFCYSIKLLNNLIHSSGIIIIIFSDSFHHFSMDGNGADGKYFWSAHNLIISEMTTARKNRFETLEIRASENLRERRG